MSQFCVEVLRGAKVVGSSGEGSDDTVFGAVGSAGVLFDVEVGVCRFAVN